MPNSKGILARELRTIRVAFRQLSTGFERIAPILAAVPEPVTLSSTARPRKKPRQPAKIKAIRADKGIRAAIAATKRMRG